MNQHTVIDGRPTPIVPNAPVVRKTFVLAAVMAANFMISVEATIVSTAMPRIAAQLGDLHLYAWVFSSFLLTQTATAVVFGKLADLYGRRPVLIVAIALFLVGSILCGFAWSMPSLILFRLLQGIGAGGIQPICLTIIGDLYPGRERGRVQGWLASVWGVSSVLGPLIGGLLTERLSWSWIFWINVPIGLAAGAGFLAFLREQRGTGARSVDAIGAALFATTIAALMFALTELGTGDPMIVAASLAVCAVAAVLFVQQERRCRDPMIAFSLWSRRAISVTNGATLLSGMPFIGLSTFLPMYVQGVLGSSALVAGFTLTAMIFGWPIAATISARSFVRVGLRAVLICGGVLLAIGTAAFVLLAYVGSIPLAAAGSLIMGLGMGCLSTAAIVTVQSSVGWGERGVATASNIFSRNLGSTLGAAAFGGVLNVSLAHGGGHAAIDIDSIRHLLDHGAALADAGLRAGLAHALHLTFFAMFVVAVLTFVITTFVPRVALDGPPQAPIGD